MHLLEVIIFNLCEAEPYNNAKLNSTKSFDRSLKWNWFNLFVVFAFSLMLKECMQNGKKHETAEF